MTGSGRYPASVFGECTSGVVGVARRLRHGLFCSESPLARSRRLKGRDGRDPALPLVSAHSRTPGGEG